MGAHERKYQSYEVRLHSFHGCKGTPPSIAAPGNVEKTMAAPVTVIIAYDLKFYDKVSRLFPHYPAMRDMFANNPQLIQETAPRNSNPGAVIRKPQVYPFSLTMIAGVLAW